MADGLKDSSKFRNECINDNYVTFILTPFFVEISHLEEILYYHHSVLNFITLTITTFMQGNNFYFVI